MSKLRIDFCCTCLNICPEKDKLVNLSGTTSEEITVRHKLKSCVPEMGLKETDDCFLCLSCSQALDTAYSFRCMCLATENKLRDHRALQQRDLREICSAKDDLMLVMLKENIKQERVDDDDTSLLDIKPSISVLNCVQSTATPYVQQLSDDELIKRACETIPELCNLPEAALNCRVSLEKISVTNQPVLLSSQRSEFYCSTCDTELPNKYRYYSHMLRHSNIRAYKCDLCTASYYSSDVLNHHKRRQHSSLNHKKKPSTPKVSPPIAKASSSALKASSSALKASSSALKASPQAVKSPLQVAKASPSVIKASPQIVKPSTVMQASSNSSTKKKVATSKKAVEPKCIFKIKFPSKAKAPTPPLNNSARMLACNLCDFETLSKHTYERHIFKHSGAKGYTCTYCSKIFCAQWELNQHVRRTHKIEVITNHKSLKPVTSTSSRPRRAKMPAPIQIKQEIFDDDEMDSNFGSVRMDHKMQVVKKKKKKYFCPICNNEFSSRDHANIHTGAKPYNCHICGKNFAAYTTLRKHRNTHKNLTQKVVKKECVCEICLQAFDCDQDLYSHRCETSSGEKVYRCQICKNAYLGRSALIEHMRLHIEPNYR
ncbi:hypothetical protein FQA39_LY17330 [Lamprigera yunnana]|nr:hypothetical protein FQA39_LY17330 [Lamprigera yunnana]